MKDVVGSREATLSRTALVAVLVVLAAGLLVPLIAHAYNALSTRYIADDFCDAATLRSAGFLRPQLDVYLNWTGRFSAYFFLYAVLLTGLWGAGYFIAAVVLLWALLAAWAGAEAARVISLPHPRLVGAILGLLIIVFSIDGAPTIDESLYWLTGFCVYALPLVFETTYIGTRSSSARGTTATNRRIAWPHLDCSTG